MNRNDWQGSSKKRRIHYFFEKNDEILFVPLAAFANRFSFADVFFSWIVAKGVVDDIVVSVDTAEKSSSDFTRFNVLFSNSINDLRFPGAAALIFSKPRCVDNFSHKSNVM